MQVSSAPAEAAPPSAAPSASPLAMDQEEQVNVNVYRKVSPGVVNITSTTYVRDFFEVYPQQGTGSGSIIDTKGHIITNYHVVRGAAELHVTLADKSTWPARLIGVDPEDDLALIRISADQSKLHVVELAPTSHLEVGQKVLAIGNPFGLDRTLTTGVISGLGRPLKTQAGTTVENVIQTDASINPGNSGGPLLNTAGQMIGVNTAIFSPSGGSVGIGFAIPVEVVRHVLKDMIEHGRVLRPWLGVAMQPLTPRLAAALGLPVRSGVIITAIARGGPADKAGLRASDQLLRTPQGVVLKADIITHINGTAVSTPSDVLNVLIRLEPKATCTLDIVRDGQPMKVKAQLEPQPIRNR